MVKEEVSAKPETVFQVPALIPHFIRDDFLGAEVCRATYSGRWWRGDWRRESEHNLILEVRLDKRWGPICLRESHAKGVIRYRTIQQRKTRTDGWMDERIEVI